MSRYLIFVVVSMSLLLAAISGTSIAVAFPVITESFNTSLVLAGWVLNILQVVSIATMPLAGKASDIFGKKFIFVGSIVFFTLGSLLCALAPNIQLLIVCRLIQGMGVGAFLPVAAGIVAETFPRSRQQLIGLFTSIFPIGQIIGPNIGGWLVSAYGWRSVFWLNVPLGIINLIAAIILLKPGKREKGYLDFRGAGLMVAAIVAILGGLSILDDKTVGVFLPLAGVLLVSGIVLIFFFVRYVNRVKEPVIDSEVLRGKPFVAANFYNFIYGFAIFGVSSFIPLYAVSIYGMTIFESGFIMTPRSLCMAIGSTLTSFFLLRWGYRRPMIFGTLVIALTLLLLGVEAPGFTLLGIPVSSMTIIVVIMVLSGLGMGAAAPAANNACIDLMPQRVAAITGVRGVFRQLGGALSIAVISLLLEKVGDMARGFSIVYFGTAVIILATLPLIFIMPRAPIVVSMEDDRRLQNKL